MKKWITRMCCVFTALMMFIAGLPISAQSNFDPNAKATLCLTMDKDGVALNGGSLECIQVASVETEDADSRYVYLPAFAEAKVPPINLENKEAAEELNRVALAKNIGGQIAPIDNGKADFGEREHGVYLIRQKDPTPGFEAITPFVITVPQYDEINEIYIYEVNAVPKTDIQSAPASSDSSESSDPSESSVSSSQSSSSVSSTSSSASSSSSKSSSSKSSSTSKKQPGGKQNTSNVKTGVFENLIGYELLAIAAFGGILLLKKFSSKERNK